MSFGFSPSDVVVVATLAWSLYQVLKDCPEEVAKISKDLATVYGILNHIKEDLHASESAIKAHGENRVKLLETMVRDLNKTLNELNKMVEPYKHIGRANGKSTVSDKGQIWVKVKWVVGQKKIKRMHQDISLHISRFGLLMTSMGNSSLMRIESGLEELRICSTLNEDSAADDNVTGLLDYRSGQKSRTSLDAAQFKNQHLNHQSSNEAGHSEQIFYIVAESIYPSKIKSWSVRN